MKRVKIYQVDAFTDTLFAGNPAAVCILDKWLGDELMQAVAYENNLAETAFLVRHERHFDIRWFTPTTEVDLCGHATLASAHVLFNVMKQQGSVIRFMSHRSGPLSVEKKDDQLFLDFPTDTLLSIPASEHAAIEKCIGCNVLESYKGKTDYLAVIDNEHSLRDLQPDLNEVSKLRARGLIVTAKGNSVDFVSRFFAPQSGIDEDPVTGSAHTSLTPYWSKRLAKVHLTAEQLSQRGGRLLCEFKNERCAIGGRARLFLSGEIYIE